MHAESAKIQSKKRLMSEHKKLEEVKEWTFTPKLVTKNSKYSTKDAPPDVRHLSLRLYQYADQFKENKEKLKEKIDSERGEEIRFTPKLQTTKVNSQLETVKEHTSVYENLYDDYKHREDAKQRLRNTLNAKASITHNNGMNSHRSTHDEIYVTSKKPNEKTKHRRFRKNRQSEPNNIGLNK